MKVFKSHIVSTIASLLIIAAILTPSIIKLSHAIYEHEEQQCESVGSLHVHEVELDCDFQKFKLSPQYHIVLTVIEKLPAPVIKEKSFDLYSFLSKYQKLHFALRGPPLV